MASIIEQWSTARVVAYYWIGCMALPWLALGPQWYIEWLRYVFVVGLYLLFRWTLARVQTIRRENTWKTSDTIVFVVIPICIVVLSSIQVLEGNFT